MSAPPVLPDSDPHGDLLRLRHLASFEECSRTGRWSGLCLDYFCRDLQPHLLAELRELDERARTMLPPWLRNPMRRALYVRQDCDIERLVGLFIADAATIGALGFGHVGGGRMGILDPVRFGHHLAGFRERQWQAALAECGFPGPGSILHG